MLNLIKWAGGQTNASQLRGDNGITVIRSTVVKKYRLIVKYKFTIMIKH